MFLGKENEEIDKFIKKFKLISGLNEWEDKDKLTILKLLYLKDSAEIFFEKLKTKV